jgi:putative aldouronate transport system permease protein
MTAEANKTLNASTGGVYSKSDRIFDWVVNILILLGLLIISYPLWYVVICSISSPYEVLIGNVFILPIRPTLQSYAKVFVENRLMRGYLNTIIYTVVGTGINLFATTTGAYALSREDLRGRSFFTKLIMFTMLFSGGLIPTYLVVNSLGLVNTMWSVTLINAVGVTNFMIMKNTFQNSIPKEVQESAIVEGCSDFSILFRIVIPLSMPIIAVMTIFYSVGHWNEYFNALIYLTDKVKQPLQVVLRDILISNEITEIMSDANTMQGLDRMAIAEGMRYSTIVIASLPMIALYPFFQRFFVKGVMVGAVKG